MRLPKPPVTQGKVCVVPPGKRKVARVLLVANLALSLQQIIDAKMLVLLLEYWK